MKKDPLQKLRASIDTIDRALISLIGRRLKLARKVAKIKKAQDLPILDKKREEAIKMKIRKLAKRADADPDLLEEIYTLLLKVSRAEMRKT